MLDWHLRPNKCQTELTQCLLHLQVVLYSRLFPVLNQAADLEAVCVHVALTHQSSGFLSKLLSKYLENASKSFQLGLETCCLSFSLLQTESSAVTNLTY